MTSADDSKNIIDLANKYSPVSGRSKVATGSEDYTAFEQGKDRFTIIINLPDGRSHSIPYSSFAAPSTECDKDQKFLSLILTSCVYILEGKNLRKAEKLIQNRSLSAINSLTIHHIRPTGDDDPIVEHIAHEPLHDRESNMENEQVKEAS